MKARGHDGSMRLPSICLRCAGLSGRAGSLGGERGAGELSEASRAAYRRAGYGKSGDTGSPACRAGTRRGRQDGDNRGGGGGGLGAELAEARGAEGYYAAVSAPMQ